MNSDSARAAEMSSDTSYKNEGNLNNKSNVKKAISLETFIFLGLFIALFGAMGSKMGAINMINTMMNTAYALLIDTVLYIMSIAVLAGAISGLFSEFGVIAMMNKILSPLMKPIYDMPGAAIIGVLSTYLSDNPAILTLADDRNFQRYFKKYQFPALTNIGTAFGMGLIITAFIIGIPSPSGDNFILAVIVGNIASIIGSVISTRLMLRYTAKMYGKTEMHISYEDNNSNLDFNYRTIRSGGVGTRFIDSMLTGAKSGVDMGIAIIPGVLIICTIVMMLTNGPSPDGYTGAAYEGIAFLPWIGEKLKFILVPLFGFSSPEAISVPLTSLGAAGAAIGLIPRMVERGIAHANDIAVFTAMCMCWSGYLSTHVAMMDSINYSHLTGKAILSHTIAGLVAGVSANWIFKLLTLVL